MMLAAGVAPWFASARAWATKGRTPPSDKITLGVLGVGSQGQHDMRDFLGHDDVRVRAICDVNQRHLDAARQIIAQRYGSPDVAVFTDFRELHADPGIDAVLMALPVHWHALAALDAIGAGKHLYHEKPMGMSLDEARRVRQATQRHGVVFQFGTQQRSDMRFRWACELALNERLGELREIHVSVPGGRQGPVLAEQPLPDYVDWDRWMGPAPQTPFHEAKLQRDTHENMTNFSLGMISCWGIHHLDIAQWANGADDTGPSTVEGSGQFPRSGSLDAILSWRVRFEYPRAAPVEFVSDGTPGFTHGVRLRGQSAWGHVARGSIEASDQNLLRDPQNKPGAMPIKLPVSVQHTRNFVDAIRGGRRAICDIETAVRSDTLCQLALIAVKQGRKLTWDPSVERFPADAAANVMLESRPYRDDWRLPDA